ncbi:unnamed protein product [Heterobilharzia americana]|nr:unnamed protein product [Heterobilharzia americana]
MMTDNIQLTIIYCPLKKFEDFFENKHSQIDLKSRRLYFSRKFDLLFILCIIVSFLLCIIHIVYVIFNEPIVPKLSNLIISHCAVYSGEWNHEKTVLRYWSIPYAIPPIIEKEQIYQDVLNDIVEKYHLQYKSLRWHKTFSKDDNEYCFLTYDDRCKFENATWFCNMHKPNKIYGCLEVDYKRKIRKGTSENCLYLDISIIPFHDRLLPVIIVLTGFKFIRNPFNRNNEEEEVAYLPSDQVIIDSNAVWVNPRYRLGPFGVFYDFNKLGRDNQQSEITYFLLHDILAVLNWVQENIDRYGGDKHRVTLLCHGSGATIAMALIQLQSSSKINQTNSLFQGIWLASGSVNWYSGYFDDITIVHLPKLVLSQLLKLCPEYSKMLDEYSRLVECRTKLNRLKTEEIINLLQEFYDDKSILRDPFQLDNTKRRVWFTPSQMKRENEPINWNETVLQKVFRQDDVTNRNSWLKSVVFSSMENEFSGFVDSDNVYTSLDESTKSTISIEKNLFTLGISKDILLNLTHRIHQKHSDILLNLISALKYTCPHGWLINYWRNYTMKYLYSTKFYHIYNTEPSSEPLIKVPGLLNSTPRNTPFHGLDMLILTGTRSEENIVSKDYENKLKSVFYNFVHHSTVDSDCEINNTYDGIRMQLGCTINANGIKRVQPNDPLDLICNHVNWTENFHKLAIQE